MGLFLVSCGAGHVFLLCALAMYFYMRYWPPGIAYTYCWLFCALLAVLTASPDALALAFCIGFGVNLSWYVSQVVDSLLWTNLIPYWHDYFPYWCTESLIRLGDILLHPIPFVFLLSYHQYVRIRTFIYAFMFERWYFLLVEGQPFGTGSTTNIIYDFRPHLPKRTFLLSQYLTNLGYFLTAVSQLDSYWLRLVSQLVCGVLFLIVCVIHTDRWSSRKHALPKFSQKFVGAALEEPAELYTEAVNAFSQELRNHVKILTKLCAEIHETGRAGPLSVPPWASVAFDLSTTLRPPADRLLSAVAACKPEGWLPSWPKGLSFSELGLIFKDAKDKHSLLRWDWLAESYALLAVHLPRSTCDTVASYNLPQFVEMTSLKKKLASLEELYAHLEFPSLEALHTRLPNVELSDLSIVRNVMQALTYLTLLTTNGVCAVVTGTSSPPDDVARTLFNTGTTPVITDSQLGIPAEDVSLSGPATISLGGLPAADEAKQKLQFKSAADSFSKAHEKDSETRPERHRRHSFDTASSSMSTPRVLSPLISVRSTHGHVSSIYREPLEELPPSKPSVVLLSQERCALPTTTTTMSQTSTDFSTPRCVPRRATRWRSKSLDGVDTEDTASPLQEQIQDEDYQIGSVANTNASSLFSESDLNPKELVKERDSTMTSTLSRRLLPGVVDLSLPPCCTSSAHLPLAPVTPITFPFCVWEEPAQKISDVLLRRMPSKDFKHQQ